MRPTGPLHLGHLLGALQNWVSFQANNECLFMVADLHALMSDYENPADISKNSIQMVMDWMACGIDPEKSAIFIQSEIAEHSELAIMLGMLTPLGWLERNPTYKEQLRELKGRDLTTFGFLGYPVLQTADIVLYGANKVPVGEDQLAHLELAREIVRRFNHLYGKNLLVEPEAVLTPQARILGTDRRKMSKSYGNAISLSDDEDALRKKVLSMVTDPARLKTTDHGHPDICNVYSYYKIFGSKPVAEEVYDWCSNAKKGCVECKRSFADILVEYLKPIRKKRSQLEDNLDYIHEVIAQGREKTRTIAAKTVRIVRERMGLYTPLRKSG
jgi:tryptophanyl-tRNA synthetase